MDKIFKEDNDAIINAMIVSGFQPTNFDINEDGLMLTVKHKTSNFYFRVTRHKSEFHTFNIKYTKFQPDYPVWIKQGINIKAICAHVEEFLVNNLKPFLAEMNSVSPWDEFTKSFNTKSFGTINFSDDSKFTVAEQENIRLGFVEFKKNVEEKIDLNADQLRYLTERVDFLVLQSKDQTKLAFQFLLYGVVLDLAKEKLPWQEIWEFMIKALEVSVGKYIQLLPFS